MTAATDAPAGRTRRRSPAGRTRWQCADAAAESAQHASTYQTGPQSPEASEEGVPGVV